MNPDAPLVGLDRIRSAAVLLRGVATRTPLVAFGDPARGQLLKAESLQPIGAFKLRGAYTAISSLGPDELRRGVITYSSGNHAQGVARAARLLGCPAVVVMPDNAPTIKRIRVLADGAEVVTVGPASAERPAVAERLAAERGLAIIPPYDDDRTSPARAPAASRSRKTSRTWVSSWSPSAAAAWRAASRSQ